MTDNDSKLEPKQTRLIAALLSESTVAKAAEKAGVSEATAYRWMRRPEFRAELARARESVVDAALSRLRASAACAVDTLRDIASDRSLAENARLAAANRILDLVFQMQDRDLEARLEQVEQVVEYWRSVDEQPE